MYGYSEIDIFTYVSATAARNLEVLRLRLLVFHGVVDPHLHIIGQMLIGILFGSCFVLYIYTTDLRIKGQRTILTSTLHFT